MPRTRLIDGVRHNFTAEEETARDTYEVASAKRREDIKKIAEDKATKKASGKQKLKDLGLDDDEIKALMGA